ncbi:Uma2 family endonuclease [Candidatus Entotheonella palauensis]|uniref:Putative restriction endonuclease domain-containing protein n=1 Tax=Candidatus Entotheonella gemina TaxID=1429439 RepID=W4L5V4_9BACT|nr:Uma2 family endonuclease [Candidatus Entotheonella palauensis]ETW93075.1 MAG: hypothetical protein ETSY2_52050 [Candidatus Entotheonella gemina]
MAMNPQHSMSPADYLAFERAQTDVRHKYLNGEILAMSGASLAHNIIVSNLVISLGMQMRGRSCNVFASDMRVKIPATGLYTYPDITALCGEPELEDDVADTLLNPQVIVEVLPPSTEAYDRGAKFAHYQSIESLQAYVLVAQDQPRLEIFLRREHGDWLYSVVNGPETTVRLETIDCELTLSDVYEGVRFASTGDASGQTP